MGAENLLCLSRDARGWWGGVENSFGGKKHPFRSRGNNVFDRNPPDRQKLVAVPFLASRCTNSFLFRSSFQRGGGFVVDQKL